MGAAGLELSPVMEPLTEKGYEDKGRFRALFLYLPYTQCVFLRFKRVLLCFLVFSWPCPYTLSGLRKAQNFAFLIMYPFIVFLRHIPFWPFFP